MKQDKIPKLIDDLAEYHLALVDGGAWSKSYFADKSNQKEVHATFKYDGHKFRYWCDHAYWEHGDREERGYCPICGATCDWEEVDDVLDNYPDEVRAIKSDEPTEWHEPEEPQGLIGEAIKALYG